MNDQFPKNQSHASSAVINFCEFAEQEHLTPYLQPILSKLLTMLQSGKKSVQEQAITAIASVADCVEDKFKDYYRDIMFILKQILFQVTIIYSFFLTLSWHYILIWLFFNEK